MISAISLFSGAGGMDVGFEAAGVNVVLANEIGQYRTEKMRNKGKCGKIWAWISK